MEILRSPQTGVNENGVKKKKKKKVADASIQNWHVLENGINSKHALMRFQYASYVQNNTFTQILFTSHSIFPK